MCFEYKHLVEKLAWKYHGRGAEYRDLQQDGYEWLLRYYDSWDKEKHGDFTPYIAGRLKKRFSLSAEKYRYVQKKKKGTDNEDFTELAEDRETDRETADSLTGFDKAPEPDDANSEKTEYNNLNNEFSEFLEDFYAGTEPDNTADAAAADYSYKKVLNRGARVSIEALEDIGITLPDEETAEIAEKLDKMIDISETLKIIKNILSKEELEEAMLAAKGASLREIARSKNISHAAVRKHFAAMAEKTKMIKI